MRATHRADAGTCWWSMSAEVCGVQSVELFSFLLAGSSIKQSTFLAARLKRLDDANLLRMDPFQKLLRS